MAERNLRSDLALALAAVLVATGLAELGLRLVTDGHEDCYGEVLGIDLPPCRLRSPYENPGTLENRSEPYGDLVVDGERITVGDLWGVARYDSILGFAPRESTASANGWWRTDPLGARIGDPTPDSAASRMLVLGDSYAVGSRLPFEDTWAFTLDTLSSRLDVTNFAMDGYGMAQAHLRYLSVRDRVEHDVVLLMFVPEEDLWRDVNVRRDVGGGWDMYWVLPRYALADDGLRRVATPFADQGASPPPGPAGTEARLRAHLREHERFFWEPWYGEPPGPPRPVLYRLLIAVIHELWMRDARGGLMDEDSEAMRVSTAIFRTLRDDARREGRDFVLAILPTEHALLEADDEFWRRWARMVDAACADVAVCVDLAADLRALPEQAIDRGYDGSHFGPGVNAEIGRLLYGVLVSRNRQVVPS